MELTLRKITKDDRDFFVENLNQSGDYPKYLHTHFPYTKKDANLWINKCLKEYKQKKPTNYHYIIILDNMPMGAIGFNVIDYNNNNAEIGCWLAKEYSGQGIMLNAMNMILDIAFKQLKLKRIYVKVCSTNKRSQKLVKKTGFKLEGTFKKDFKYNRKYYDMHVYAIIN